MYADVISLADRVQDKVEVTAILTAEVGHISAPP